MVGWRDKTFEQGFLAKLDKRRVVRNRSVVVRLTEEEHRALLRDATRRGVSVSAYVRAALQMVIPDERPQGTPQGSTRDSG